MKEHSKQEGDKAQGKVHFLDAKSGDAKVEALICVWRIDNGGQLMKDKEISFSYDAQFVRSEKVKIKL